MKAKRKHEIRQRLVDDGWDNWTCAVVRELLGEVEGLEKQLDVAKTNVRELQRAYDELLAKVHRG